MIKDKKTWLLTGVFRSFGEALAQAADQLHGQIDTPILDRFVANGQKVLREEGAKERLGRAGQPDEIVNVILFVSVAESSFMTGAEGRYTAR